MKLLKVAAYVGLSLYLTGCGETKTAQEHIEQAQTYIANEQYDAGAIELKNAVKLASKNPQVRFLLGELYLKQGKAENAEKELARAYELGYDKSNILPLLARAYYLMESDEEIIALYEESLSLEDDKQVQYLAYKTIAHIRLDEKDEAQISADFAQKILPNSEYALLAQGFLQFSKQEIDQALASINNSLAVNADNPEVVMLHGQLSLIDGNTEQGIVDFKHYQTLQPESGKIQLYLADAYIQNQQFSEAEKIADAFLKVLPNQPIANAIKATTRFEEKDYESAYEYAERALNRGYNSFRLKLIAGASAFYLNNFEQSNLHLSFLAPYLPAEHPARRMLAISQLQLGLIDEIGQTLENYHSSDNADANFLTALSFELLEMGAIDQAKNIAAQASSSGDGSAEQAARAGMLKLMMNDASGIAQLEEALTLNPELIEAELTLAFAAINMGDLDKGYEIAEKWQNKYPDKAGGYNLTAAINFKEEKFEIGRAALEKSLVIEPNNVYALTELSKLAYYEKDIPQAEKFLAQALQAHPGNTKVLKMNFELLKSEEALNAIKIAYDKKPEDIRLGIVYGEALIKLQRFDQALAVIKGYTPSRKTPKIYWQIYLLANSQASKEMQEDNLDIFKRWNSSNHYHIEPVVLMADYWTRKNDINAALAAVNRVLEYNKGNLELQLVKLEILISSKRVSDAKIYYKSLSDADMSNAVRAVIQGRILLLEEKYAQAITEFKAIYQQNQTPRNARYLSVSYIGNKQRDKAISMLEQYTKDHPEDNDIRNYLANLYLEGQHERALEQYEQVVTKEPNNVLVLNNIAWLYMEKGELDKAIGYAQSAYELAPNNANVADTYAQVLLHSGKADAGLQKAEEAYQSSQGKDVDIALNYAQALLANNRKNEAETLLNQLVMDTPEQKQKLKQLKEKF